MCFCSKTGPLTSERVERFRTANKSWRIAVVTSLDPSHRLRDHFGWCESDLCACGPFLGLGSTDKKTLQESHVASDTLPKSSESRCSTVPAATAPHAERRPTVSTRHGVTLTDDYAWLRADNWREVMRDPSVLDPAIRTYLEAENAYEKAALAHTAPLQEKLFAEMKGRIKEDDSSVPSPDGAHAYYHRYREGGQHPIVCRQPRDGGAEDMLLDGDALAAGKAYFQLGATHHSPDHRLLAWSSDDKGSEYDTLRVRDLATGSDLADIDPRRRRPAGMDRGFIRLLLRAAQRQSPSLARLSPSAGHAGCRRRAGLRGEGRALLRLARAVAVRPLRARFRCTITRPRNAGWSILPVPTRSPSLVAAREASVQYDVEHHPNWNGEETLVIRTNAGGAEDFKIALAPLARPGRDNWRDLVPHRRGTYVLSVTVLADWMIRLERQDGLPRIVVRQLATGEEHALSFAEEAYSLGSESGYEFATDRLRFHYSSMTTPNETWDYDLKTRARNLAQAPGSPERA